jgi:hypothetical protein
MVGGGKEGRGLAFICAFTLYSSALAIYAKYIGGLICPKAR